MSGCGTLLGQRMDEDQLMSWILRRLGAPLLKIELTVEHLQDAVKDSLHWYAAKKGFIRQYKQPIYPSVTQYKLDDNIDIVTDVVFPLSVYDLTPLTSPWGWAWPNENLGMPLNGLYSGFYGAGGESGGVLSTFQQVQQYSDMARRTMNADLEWRQEDRTLYILPRNLNNYYPEAIVFYSSRTFTVQELNERDHDLVKRYALARAKLDLGRIRSKYDAFPTAQGSTGLDGGTLLGEGQAEIEVLDTEIGDSAMPVGFITG